MDLMQWNGVGELGLMGRKIIHLTFQSLCFPVDNIIISYRT